MNRLLRLLMLSSLISACQSLPVDPIVSKNDRTAAHLIINDQRLPEISGLAASTLKPRQFWAINDSGNPAIIYRLNLQYSIVQSVLLNTKNRDWEDLTTYFDGEFSWIVVAETGDNLRQYENYFLYFFREDKLLSAGRQILKPDRILKFIYSDGSQNCEAVAIDNKRQEILLLSKNKNGSGAYRLPLRDTKKTDPLIAVKIAELSLHPAEKKAPNLVTLLTGVNLDAITALALSTDSHTAIMLTYRGVWMYRRNSNQDWGQVLARPAIKLSAHSLAQAEALAIFRDRSVAVFTSERLPAPVVHLAF